MKNIAECDDLAHIFMKLDFGDSTNDVAFKHDVHDSVANAGSVKKSRRVRQQLFALFGNFHERRNAVKENDACIVAVDESFVEMRGQNCRTLFGTGFCVVERGVDLSVVDFDNGADEFFETQQNGLANVGRNFTFAAFGGLTGHCAVNNAERNTAVAFVEIREAGTANGVVEFVERVGVVASVVVGDVVDSNDVAIAFDLFLLKDFALFTVANHASELLLLKVVDDFAELEIGNETQFNRHDLKIFFGIHEGFPFVETVNRCCQHRRQTN